MLCDTFEIGAGNDSNTTNTRFRAHFPLPAGPVFDIHRRHVFSKLFKALGTQYVELDDDADFDRIFTVRSNKAEATRAAWSREAKQLMMSSFQDCYISSDGDEVKLFGPGSWMDASRIDRAIDLVGVIANADLFGASALRALPGANYIQATGTWRSRIAPCAIAVLQATEVAIGPLIQPRKVVGTRATTQLKQAPHRRIAFGIDRGVVCGEVPDGFLPPEAAALLQAISGAQLELSTTGELHLTWQSIEHDVLALMAGARLLVLIAGTESVYR